MPSIDFNKKVWGQYSWPAQGDEWSTPWGGAETQWHAMIMPRIRHFVPADRVLEIAPGYGRWSAYLIELSNDYVGVDLAQECVAACKQRFQDVSKARFCVNDGRSLAAVDDQSIDFAFSFDSLVHVEIDTIAAYCRELARTLNQDGVAFIHHSNLGEFQLRHLSKMAWDSRTARKMLRGLGLSALDHWRSPSVTASDVKRVAAEAGLTCIGQEIINWRTRRRMIDCFSILTPSSSRYTAREHGVIARNPFFMMEAASCRAIACWQKNLLTKPGSGNASSSSRSR